MSITLRSVAYLHGPDDQIEEVLPELVEQGWEIESRTSDACCLTMESQHVPDLEHLALGHHGSLMCVANTTDNSCEYLWHQSVCAGSFLAVQKSIAGVQRDGIQVFQTDMWTTREATQLEICTAVSECKLSAVMPTLTELRLEEARVLSRHRGVLRLPALKAIDPEVTRELVQHLGPVELDGLEECSPALAESLMTGVCSLSLGGLTHLSAKNAQIFSSRRARVPDVGNTGLSLGGLIELDLEAARALNKYPGCLSLGCPTLTAEAAQALVQRNGYTLTLSRLTELPADLAAALSESPGDLCLPAVESLSAEAAKALAKHRGNVLALNGVRSLSPEVAQGLAGHRGTLGLYGLKRASQDVLDALKNHNGPVVLGIEGGRTLRRVYTEENSSRVTPESLVYARLKALENCHV